MKNIHILPIDKPSRLYEDVDNDLQLGYDFIVRKGMLQNQHIYITSDEEIKEGDWVLSKLNEVVRFGKKFNPLLYKKIILTTDQDLIDLGVQSIDDEFLEWFVKNPSCEWVHTEKVECQMWSLIGCSKDDVGCCGKPFKGYKIIIPKEERKHPKILSENGNELFFDEKGNMKKEELKKETILEEHNYLQGFINQFEEEGEYQELSNDDWTVSRFLEWLKHNNFKIIKNAN